MGATIACAMAGIAMSCLGRRGATLMLTIPTYSIGFLLIGCAKNIGMIVAGRLLTGLGLGKQSFVSLKAWYFICLLIPGLTLCIPNVYLVEVTSPEYRGVLGVIPNLFCQLGIFITYVMGHWLDWSQLAFACKSICLWFFNGQQCQFPVSK